MRARAVNQVIAITPVTARKLPPKADDLGARCPPCRRGERRYSPAQRLNAFGQELAALLLAHRSCQAEFLQRGSRQGIPHMDTLRVLSEGVKALLVAQNQINGAAVYSWLGPPVPARLSFVSGEQER
jgi:hypothetical protein